MATNLRRRAFALLPPVAQRRLADLALTSSMGRDRLGMALRSLEAFGCDRFALAGVLRRLRRLDDFPALAACEAEAWLERGQTAQVLGHSATARDHLAQATLFFALADWMAEGTFKRANFARLVAASDALRALAAVPTQRVTVAGCPAYWRLPPAHDGACVVIVQGTNSSRDMFFALEEMLLARGAAVLNLDQPGTGECLLLGRRLRDLADLRPIAEGIFAFLAEQPHPAGWRVGAFGFSLGGFVAPALCALDERFRAAAMVATGLRVDARLLDALPPQLKARAMAVAGAATWGEARAVAARALDLEPLAGQVRCPVRAYHGERDGILPAAGAHALFRALASPDKRLTILPGADHTCSTALRSQVLPDLFDWLTATLRPASAPAQLDAPTRTRDRD